MNGSSTQTPPADVRSALVDSILSDVAALRHHLKTRVDPHQQEELGSLTVHQLEGLVALYHGERTMQEFCDLVGISESAGTALVDRLIARGYVVRDRDASDRRIVRISLSEGANAMVSHYKRLTRERASKLFADFETVELEEFARLLAKANHHQSESK